MFYLQFCAQWSPLNVSTAGSDCFVTNLPCFLYVKDDDQKFVIIRTSFACEKQEGL